MNVNIEENDYAIVIKPDGTVEQQVPKMVEEEGKLPHINQIYCYLIMSLARDDSQTAEKIRTVLTREYWKE